MTGACRLAGDNRADLNARRAAGILLGIWLWLISAFPGATLAAQQPVPAETIHEIRIHGNAALVDADVLKLAGVAVGDPIGADTLKAIERRLKDSGRFETIEVRKRYRSLDDPTDVALVLLVHERPGVSSANPDVTPIARPWHRLKSRLMFLPIIDDDEYGFTYGGRISTVNLLGIHERLSVPLTWGGTKRAALELERVFKRGPLTRITSSVGIWNGENPFFNVDDQRVEVKAGAERQITRFFRTGVNTTRSSVSFGALDDRLWTFGANATFDTRDPTFPINAVYLDAGWSALNVKGQPRINRYTSDARGYLRIRGQSVLAARAQYATADGALPPYERLLLGGSSTLRGYRNGSFDGDRLLVTSAEVRAPITSVLSNVKLGVTVFFDAAKAVDFGERLRDSEWHRGAGGGLFLAAPFVRISVDVGHALKGGSTRVSLGAGFSF